MKYKGPYQIVTEKGEVIVTCQLKLTAIQTLQNYRMCKNEKLNIVRIKKDGESSIEEGRNNCPENDFKA